MRLLCFEGEIDYGASNGTCHPVCFARASMLAFDSSIEDDFCTDLLLHSTLQICL